MEIPRLRDKDFTRQIIQKLESLQISICIMHVCGTHQDTLVRHGLSSILQKSRVDIRQGPGCPVCVTTPKEIEEAILLANSGKTIMTFGDMFRVPGQESSLLDARTQGADVRIVYSIDDAVKIAKSEKNDVVFIGVGFETTAPATAQTILDGPPDNFSILNCHRYVPPALDALINMGELNIQGFIQPGHVSTIIGLKPYRKLAEKKHIPQVVAGFEPLDLLMATFMLAKQIKNNEAKVENEYSRVVKEEGNVLALKALNTVFEPQDVEWRGFPVIPRSGMALKSKYKEYDARYKFQDELAPLEEKEFPLPPGCKCHEVLRGLITSQECSLFAIRCTPQNPIGPCMVSAEGSCNIEYRYGQRTKP